MNDLKGQIEKTRQRNLLRLKENYRLARDLGFDSYTANVMAQWSRKKIIEFSKSNTK